MWIKENLNLKVPIGESCIVKISFRTKDTNATLNIDFAFGYRKALSLRLKVLLMAGLLVFGIFMCIIPKYFFYDSFIDEWKKEKEEENVEREKQKEWRTLDKKSKYTILSAILIVFTIISAYVQYDKEGYHVDEVLTYMLANHTNYSEIPINQKLTNGKDILDTYLSVNDLNSAFNYRNVWENQHQDTHPPIYYVFVHTLCSFFPNIFNKWIAFGVNWFFGILSIIVLNRLYEALLKNENIALVCTALFAINPAIIEMTSFLRMYVMAMFFCTLSAYWIIKNWGKFGIRFLVGNSLILITGVLTHYYFLIYAFLVSCVIAFYLLLHKKVKETFRFVYAAIVSAAMVFLIFPGIQYHLLQGGRGPENIENFFRISDYWERICEFVKIISTDIMKGLLLLFMPAALIGYIIERKRREKSFAWKIFSIGMPTVGYFFIVAKVASYITDRYMTLIYSIILIWVHTGVWLLVNRILKNAKRKVLIIFSVVFLSVTLWGYSDYIWDYNGGYYKAEIKPAVEQLSAYDCICIGTDKWRIWPSYPEFIQYKTITFTNIESAFELNVTDYNGEKLVVYITIDRKGEAEKILKQFNQYKNCDVIHEDYSYCDAYLLY